MPTSDELALSSDAIGRLADIILALQRCFITSLSATLAEGEVSFVQFFLLTHICAHESLSMTEIAERMGHTTAAATGLVDRLERLDYVSRTTDPHDRRKVLVRINPKGTDFVSEIRLDMTENLSKVMRTLRVDEQHMWLQIYEKIFAFCQAQPPLPLTVTEEPATPLL